jgi:hypothetical protein
MAETEVESILREIRERVISQQQGVTATAARSATANGTNGSAGFPDSYLTQQVGETLATENLALISSYLTTTARAWERLPPLVSNRSGLAARLELWLKRRLKSGTRWFTWEQMNFNAAVHHALRDMLQVLSAYEQELGKLRTEANAVKEARRIEFERHQTELTAQRAEIETLRLIVETQRLAAEAQRVQVDARLVKLARELRERLELLQDEQRVLFKQLALEASEATMLEDRARRKSEALVEELKRRVEELEK